MDAINMNVDRALQRSDQDTNTRFKSTVGRPSIAVTVGNHMYFVDPNAGLILHSTRKLSRHRVVSRIEVYVGLDTKLPTQARDSEELGEALLPFDAWLNKKYFSAKKGT